MELERACVQGVSDIQEAAAVGVPSPGGGPEQLVLFVVPRDTGASGRNPKIKAQCQAAIRSKLNPLFKVDRVSSRLSSILLMCYCFSHTPDMRVCIGIPGLLLQISSGWHVIRQL